MAASAIAAAVITAGSVATLHPSEAAHVATGLEAHSVCSAVFVQGVDAGQTHRQMVGLLVGPAIRLLHYRIDRPGQAVDADLAGLARAHARFIPGYGCRLDQRGDRPPPSPAPPLPPPPDDGFAPDGVVAPTDPAIAAGLDRVFTERPDTTLKQVKAVVVVKDGRVIAERYAAGYGPRTPMLSYSVAKSFTNAMLGVLVRQGKLAMDRPLRPPEWSKPGDPRASITAEDLLRMRSGLAAYEDDSATSPIAQMEFIQSDMAHYVAGFPLKAPIGARYDYTSA
ncbi:MAG: serine hydrolase, partial [Proteobacteria bacterium]|nr:serine hydrolase [Pseudomonadota bacterium]